MVYLPSFGVTQNFSVAEGANVNVGCCHYASVLHTKSVPTLAAMIHLSCTHGARHGCTAMRANVFAQFTFLRCCSFALLLFRLQVCLPFSSLGFSVLALLCLSVCFLCCGVVRVSFPVLFAARSLDIRAGHFVVMSALVGLRPFSLRLDALLFSFTFPLRDGIPHIGNGTCLFFVRCPHRHFRLRGSYPLHSFADAPSGNGALPAVATDLVTITRPMLRQPCFKRARCLLYLADAASPPAPRFSRTIQTHSTAIACPLPRRGRKFRFVLARLANTAHLCLLARLTNTIKCRLWACMFCHECIFLFPGRACHALPRLLRFNMLTNALFADSSRICAFPSPCRERGSRL